MIMMKEMDKHGGGWTFPVLLTLIPQMHSLPAFLCFRLTGGGFSGSRMQIQNVDSLLAKELGDAEQLTTTKAPSSFLPSSYHRVSFSLGED